VDDQPTADESRTFSAAWVTVLAGLNSDEGIRQTPEAAVALLGLAFGRDDEVGCSGNVVYATVSTEGHGAVDLPDVLVKALSPSG
jgi:hypothetical protein